MSPSVRVKGTLFDSQTESIRDQEEAWEKKKSAENAENQLATTQDIKIKSVETVEIEADIKPLLSERRIEGLERD